MLFPVLVIVQWLFDWGDFRAQAPRPPVPQLRVSMCSGQSPRAVIPVWSKNASSFVDAWVSPEDEDRVRAAAKNWYLSNTGYVVSGSRSQGKYKLTYMQKIVIGGVGMVTHLNGDRLDNRRCNLINKQPRDFIIHTPDLQATDLLNEGMVEYTDGKVYQGSLREKKPHGPGILYDHDKMSVGQWWRGVFQEGVMAVFRGNAPEGRIRRIVIIRPPPGIDP